MDSREVYQEILDLSRSDPDIALELIRRAIDKMPELKDDRVLTLCTFKAHFNKGIDPVRQKADVDWVLTADRKALATCVSDEHLDDLESALSIAKVLEVEQPTVYERLTSDVDVLSLVLERCRPGRVQELFGKTKLLYFGLERVKPFNAPLLTLSDVREFSNSYFAHAWIVRSALVLDRSVDSKGRSYLTCFFLDRVFEDLDPDQPIGHQGNLEVHHLFIDGGVDLK